MGTISKYLAGKLLNHFILGNVYTSPTDIYMALSKANPLSDGTGISEPLPATYHRKAITFDVAANHKVTQDAVVQFDQALDADWGIITHYALYDALTGGNLLAFGSLSTPANVDQYKTIFIPLGETYIEITHDISDYLANKLLNLAFNNTAYTPPTLHFALSRSAVTATDTGSSIGEFTMTNYVRQTGATWNPVVNESTDNSSLINWGVLVGSADIIEAVVVLDSGTVNAGNILMYDNDPSVTVDVGDRVRIDIEAYTATLT